MSVYKIEIKAILVGIILLILLSVLIGVIQVYVPYRNIFVFDGTHLTDLLEVIILYSLAAFIVFRLSKKNKMFNAVFFGIFCVLLEIIFAYIFVPIFPVVKALQKFIESEVGTYPMWFSVMNTVAIIASGILGGILGTRTQKK